MGKSRVPQHRAITELRHVVVGWEQECVVCGTTFRSRKPAESCSESCKQRRKRARSRRKTG